MKKSLLPVLVFTAISITLTNCNITNKGTTPPVSGFFFVHASADAPNFDVFASGSVVAYNFPYKADTGYFIVNPQTFEFKVAPTGTTNYVLTNIVPLSADTYYSLFLVDSLKKIKLVSVRDRIIVPGSDSAAVRFLQFSPNTPYLTAQLQNSTDTLKFTGRTFNDQVSDTTRSTFKPLKAGTYSLALYLMGSGTPFISFQNISLVSGKDYSVYLSGFYEGTGAQALDKSIIQHTR
ncbi:MAG TPA: DUF4397 domain-containing protein [Panacibacter sp.]|nr:DUF4397 domain-containing protein [Panacibacter sp.]HNP46789.1 DUF4397 domain-containing protein [Panacibacter sp.]